MASMEVRAPAIVVFSETRDNPTDIRVTIEDAIFDMPSLVTAIHFCFATYYVFNLSFPHEYRLVLLFLEKYIYHLKTSVPKLPLSVVTLNDNLRRVADAH